MFFLSKLCSLCLSSYEKLEPELLQKNEEILIQKKLIYCLPEIIDTHSAILKHVCSDCINKLESFYKFKQICLQSNMHLKNYFQTLTSTTGESYKYLSVKLTDIQYQNKLINQTMSTVGSVEEPQTEEKQDNEIYIKEEVLTNETEYVDEIEKTENNIGIEEEILAPEFIKCESILSDSEHNSDIEFYHDSDILHEDIQYCNSNSETNKLNEPTEMIITEKNKSKDLKMFQCSKCKKKFMHKRSLLEHEKIHIGIKNYECAICKKKFMYKCNLVEHEKTHTDIKSYECALCKKKFVQKSYLVKHEKTHSDIKNHECAICKKKFIQKSYLVKHEKIHSSIKNYECAVCKKKFMFNRNLVVHEKVHTGIKNYECAVCKKKFMQKYNLRKHEKIHTGIKDYECLICKKKFMYKRSLLNHEKDHIVIKNECS